MGGISCARACVIDNRCGGDGLADPSSRGFVKSRRLEPEADNTFFSEFLGRRWVVVWYTQGNENRRQCLHIGCCPEHRIWKAQLNDGKTTKVESIVDVPSSSDRLDMPMVISDVSFRLL